MKNIINTGRILQRIWLKASRAEMGLQPVSGLGFAMQRIKANEADAFSDEHKKIIRENYKKLVTAFDIGDRPVGMLFRIGRSSPAKARSSRKYPDIIKE